MAFVLALFSFVFLVAGITMQLVSYLSPYMYENTLIALDHQGLFRRCGDFTIIPIQNNFYTNINSLVSGPSSVNGCYWWNKDIFNRDQRWLQAIMILAIVSAGIISMIFIFSLVTLIPRFKTRCLRIFVGVLSLFNSIILATVVTIYTTLNDRSIKFSGGSVNFSWSYWLLYGSFASYLITSIFFCCNQPTRRD